MTAIVGLRHNGAVFIGGDSAAIADADVEVRRNSKVFRNGDYLFGFSGSFRVGQVLQYGTRLKPLAAGADLVGHLVKHLTEELKQIVGKETLHEIVVAHSGRLFKIDAEYAVAEYSDHVAAGGGEHYALGSLADKNGEPIQRVLRALAAAQANCAGVRPPFHVKVASATQSKGRQS